MDAILLPLARSAAGGDPARLHRHTISVPERSAAHLELTALAAVATLLNRYTAVTEVLVGHRRGSESLQALQLKVTSESSAGEVLAAAAIAVSLTHRAEPSPGEPSPALLAVVTGAQDVGAGLQAPLTVVLGQGDLQLVLRDSDFSAESAAQYALHLQRIVAAFDADPAVAVSDVALLEGGELKRILLDWNDTDSDIPDAFFHERITGWAQKTPDVTAVTWPGGSLTFRELDEAANRLAHRLAALGIGRQDRVAVCFDRGAESLIAQLACFKLVAAVVLLDPSFPSDRLLFMIGDAGSSLVLTTAADESKVSGIAPVVCLDTSDWADEPAGAVSVPTRAEDLIHVCYTSGSTGLPKAVLVPHGACRTLIHSMAAACAITSTSRGTWLAAPGYGMVQVECFTVLAAGAPVFIPEPSVVTSPQWLRDWLVQEQITHTLLMKAMAERLWTLDWPEHTALRNIRICGERVAVWPSADLPFHIFNLYGSAEATVVATCDLTVLGQSLGAEGRAERLPPIGHPTTNVKTYVLGEDLRPVPPGVVGQLCVAGESLSSGYLNQPQATAEKWVANPFDPARYPFLYQTGDLARFHLDGSIEIVGRTDNQVKVRGNRVHLGEIEVVISALPGVRQAAVLAKKDDRGDTHLVAYIEPDESSQPSVPDIRRALQQALPSFMVPAAYMIDPRLPLTTNGKIDRANLPEPPKVRPELDAAYTEPRDDVELAVLQVWSSTLGIQGLGVLDNFFEVGGDSLLAAALVEEIRSKFAVGGAAEDLFDVLFQDPSVAQMALAIRPQLQN